jgi:uncharacterized protein YbcI
MLTAAVDLSPPAACGTRRSRRRVASRRPRERWRPASRPDRWWRRAKLRFGCLAPIRSRPFVSQHTVQQRPRAHGDVLTAISDGMVALLKEFYGHGPSRTKSYYADDLVVCVLRGGFSRVEQTLLEGGRGAAVIQQRMEFQELMRERFEEVIEQATGRAVIGFMSGNQQHPDMMCEVFILAPTDLVDAHEIAANGRPSPPGWRKPTASHATRAAC